MEIQKALTFFTDDERWTTKLGIAAAVAFFSFLIIPAFMLMGYGVEVARNVRDGVKNPLPEWDYGRHLQDGFKLGVAMFVYFLPAILLMSITMGSVIMAAVLSGDDRGDALGALIGGGFLLVMCLMLIYGLIIAILSPAINLQYIREGTIGSCFRFSEIIATTREHFSKILLILGVMIAVSFVLGIVSSTGIGVLVSFVAGAYTTVVYNHLYGQLAAEIGGHKATQSQW